MSDQIKATFPMSTVRRVRDGRHILLWPDPGEWPEAHELVKPDITQPVVGSWDAGERAWYVKRTIEDEEGYQTIDDDFVGWANLPPVDGAP